eukprot:CAMPEP_0178614358 /NCGR_PEP_ID=MMETSP0698-20121128/2120_1 /TAXON_ID=265572 /ORGANISM="Extubocellulus spinifer, Strain CCMP396" /LENGTH=45 /DNA_ID= /DNA_START= /DNA_END= /DNA_ORIENTATION=
MALQFGRIDAVFSLVWQIRKVVKHGPDGMPFRIYLLLAADMTDSN